jgi:hypothetical protein
MTVAKECRPRGNITNYGGKSWLCDPSGGLVSSSNKKVGLLDLLINLFFRVFS